MTSTKRERVERIAQVLRLAHRNPGKPYAVPVEQFVPNPDFVFLVDEFSTDGGKTMTRVDAPFQLVPKP